MKTDAALIEIFLTPIRICAGYQPAFGQSGSDGINLSAFRTLNRDRRGTFVT